MSNLQEKKEDYFLSLDNSGQLTKMDIIEQNLNAIDFGYEQCKKEYEEKLRFIPVEENLPKYYGDPFYILVKNKNNEPNLVYIEEHSDIEDIRGCFTHWRSFL